MNEYNVKMSENTTDSISKCFGVLPLCLSTSATPHFHCPLSVKCTYVSLDEESMRDHIEECSVKPATIPEESYLICSKVQAFCVSGQDKAKMSSGQKHYHCAGYPECLHVNSKLHALKSHIFRCDKLCKRLDLYPVCSELQCRHQYDENKYHFHCNNCNFTSDDFHECNNHKASCTAVNVSATTEINSDEENITTEQEYNPVYIALVSSDDRVIINIDPCHEITCMKMIDINKKHQKHFHCPACDFCSVEQEDVHDHFNHIHYNPADIDETEPIFEECMSLDVSCCAEKRIEQNKTIMTPVLHYHCPTCKEFSDCGLDIVKMHYTQCDTIHPNKKLKVGREVQIYNSEDIITEVVEDLNESPHDMMGSNKRDLKLAQIVEDSVEFNHTIIECSKNWPGCSINRGVNSLHYHCPYCTWSSSLLVNIEAHMPSCLEKLSSRFEYDMDLLETDGYESPVEFPMINRLSKDYIQIMPCYKRTDKCSRVGTLNCKKTSKMHWHCPICTMSGGKVSMQRHFLACISQLDSLNLDDPGSIYLNENGHRVEMIDTQLKHSDSEDSDFVLDEDYTTPESLKNVKKCYKKVAMTCVIDEYPGRPLHYHCPICSKPDLNKKRLEIHQVDCLRMRATALREMQDPKEIKYSNPPNVIVCRQREATCNTADSKRVTHFHCSVCSYISYRKDRAENHVQKNHLGKMPRGRSVLMKQQLEASLFQLQQEDDQLGDYMERCEQDITECKRDRKADPRRRAHWHCNRCDFVDYKRYRVKCHVLKNHLDPDYMKESEMAEPIEEILSSDEEEDEVAGIFSCINNAELCTRDKRGKTLKKHWHCSLCNFWGASKPKVFKHYVKCLRRGRRHNSGQNFMISKTKQFLNPIDTKRMDSVDLFQVPTYSSTMPLIFCTNTVYQCTFPLNTRLDDKGQVQHWHCPLCDLVGFGEFEGLKHYLHCQNFVEFHIKSQIPDTIIDMDVLQCTKDIQVCNPSRKREVKKQLHYHCPMCPYVDYRKNRVDNHLSDICCGKASSTHIVYCSAEIEKCSSGSKGSKPGYLGHWHCSMCPYVDYNKKKLAQHYRDCYIVNQKYGSRYGYEESDDELNDTCTSSGAIRYPDIDSLNEKELTSLKIIPCSRRLPGCETGSMNLDDQPLHYHCPVCTKSDYLQKMIRHFPRCLKHLDKKRKGGFDDYKSISTPKVKRMKKSNKTEMRKIRNEGLGCQMIDKHNGIFVVRGSAVGLGFPVHVIFKKTHPKEFHCEAGCEMPDRQLCKHLAAVEKYVRDHGIFKDDSSDHEFVHMNDDFPDLDQIDLFHSLSDDEKCNVYTLHNYCLDNNTPVITPFQTFKYSDGEETSCTFYSVCSAMFKGYYTRSGRVITTFNKKTQKYLCKCFYKECVHTTITKIFRSATHCMEKNSNIDQSNITHNNTLETTEASLNSSNDNFLDNLYGVNEDKRFLKIVHCDL